LRSVIPIKVDFSGILEGEIKYSEIPVDVYAYIGDAVMNLIARMYAVGDGRIRVMNAQRKAAIFESAVGQAKLLDTIWDLLKGEEKTIASRGMNSKGARRRGNSPVYRKSTGLEALMGYLFLKGESERINELFHHMSRILE